MPSANGVGEAAGGIAQLINTPFSIFGGFQANNQMADLIRARNDAAALTRDQIMGNSMPLGSPWNLFASAYTPYNDISGGMSAGGFIPDFWRQFVTGQQGQLGDYQHYNLPNYGNINYGNSFFDNQYMPQVGGMSSRMDYNQDQAYNNYAAHGATPNSQSLFDTTMSYLNGNNPYMQNQFDVGNYMLSTGGSNPNNNSMLNQGSQGVERGGYNSYIDQLFNRGGQAAGQGQVGLNQGMGQGMSLMNSPFSSQAQGLMNYGMSGLDRFSNNMNPESFLGARGSAALDSLGSSPYIPQTFANAQNYMNQATRNGGYTPQDSYMFDNSAGRGFQNMDRANMNAEQDRGAVYNNLVQRDELPSWFSDLQNQMMGPQGLGGMGGGMGVVSGGGSAGGASAVGVSRNLGTMDPKVQQLLDKGQELFNKDPLISMSDRIGIARNRALADAKGGFGNAMERAVQLGGAGPRVAGGGAANQALFENEDQALANISKATGDAMTDQQGLQLQRSMQGSDMAKAMQAIEQQRQQMMMGANIADANNGTQASIANGGFAESGANRAMQASMATAQNQIALAQMRAGMLNNIMNNATGLRGQNMDSNSRSLNTLTDMQNSGNQRLGMLFDSANQAGNRANQRFGMGASAFNPMDASSQNDINRWTSMINPLVAGQGTATNRAALFSQMPGQGLSAGLNSQDSRIGTGANLFGNSATSLFSGGMTGMNNANNTASQNLGTYGNIFQQGDNSQLNRMRFGGDLINNGMNQSQGFLGAGNTNVANTNSYGIGNGQLSNSFANTQGSLWNNAGQLHQGYGGQNLQGQQLNQNGYNNYFQNQTNSFAPFQFGAGMANGNYQNIQNQMMQYMMGAQNLWSPYMGMMGLQSPVRNNFGG